MSDKEEFKYLKKVFVLQFIVAASFELIRSYSGH